MRPSGRHHPRDWQRRRCCHDGGGLRSILVPSLWMSPTKTTTTTTTTTKIGTLRPVPNPTLRLGPTVRWASDMRRRPFTVYNGGSVTVTTTTATRPPWVVTTPATTTIALSNNRIQGSITPSAGRSAAVGTNHRTTGTTRTINSVANNWMTPTSTMNDSCRKGQHQPWRLPSSWIGIGRSGSTMTTHYGTSHGLSAKGVLLPVRTHSTLAPVSTSQPATNETLTVPIGIAHEASSLIPTVHEALIAGVWQSTTVKRDKLLELKGELVSLQLQSKDMTSPLLTLDDVATERQKLDLWLVDGLMLIAKATETRNVGDDDVLLTTLAQGIAHTLLDTTSVHESAVSSTTASDHGNNAPLQSQPDDFLNQAQWETSLESIGKQLERTLTTLPAPNQCLHVVRDFMPLPLDETKATNQSDTEAATPNGNHATMLQTAVHNDDTAPIDRYFEDCVTRFRIQTALAVVSNLKTSWTKWTTVTDQDVDRAAVQLLPTRKVDSQQGANLSESAEVLPRRSKLCAVLVAFLCQPSTQRLEALWRLMDKDDDGLLDQIEMDHVCAVTVKVTQDALRQQLNEALAAAPLDHIIGTDGRVDKDPGWWKRRRVKSEKTRLTRMMQMTLNHHFENEVEMANRLRCIYAWANKSHQNNKMDSVLVSSEAASVMPSSMTTLTGRQRYVELHPKISLPEFREVQSVHLASLDQVGSEFMSAFRDEVLVRQGKERQSRELQRDCAVFFTAVCVLDFIILSL